MRFDNTSAKGSRSYYRNLLNHTLPLPTNLFIVKRSHDPWAPVLVIFRTLSVIFAIYPLVCTSWDVELVYTLSSSLLLVTL